MSGFASLTLQIVWTRLLALILGPTTYAFSLIVAIFIIGLAGGATIGAWLAARTTRATTGLACCLLASVGLSIAAASTVNWALLHMAQVVAHPGYQFGDVLLREVGLVSGMLLPMTLAFGAAFPFAVAVATGRDETVTEDLGRIYAVNTVGAIAGALLAGFVLVPQLGLHDTIRLVSVLAALAAGGLVAASRDRGRVVGLGAAVAVFAAAAFLPPWNHLLLSSGAYKYAASLRGPDLQTALTAGELLSYREGATGTVAVRRLAGSVSLAIDGKVDASSSGDMLTQRLLAHVPLLLHPAAAARRHSRPRQRRHAGLGTHPPAVGSAVVLEISPEVVAASSFFEAENHHALANPKTRLVVGDGRTHLLLGREQYDVIVSEPSNPWMAGIASLFTQEFFEAARARLAPGGLLCQWAHTYDISSDDLRSIVGHLPLRLSERDDVDGGRCGRAAHRLHRAARRADRRSRGGVRAARGRGRPRLGRRHGTVLDPVVVRGAGARPRQVGGRRAPADRRSHAPGILGARAASSASRERTTPSPSASWRARGRRPRPSRRRWPAPRPPIGATGAPCSSRPTRIAPPTRTSRARSRVSRPTPSPSMA